MRAFAVLIVALISLVVPRPVDDPSTEALIKAGHFKHARTIVQAEFKANKNDAELNYLMSEIDDAFGDLDTARSLAEKAVSINSQDARYHRQLGDVYGETAEKASLFAKGGWAKKFKAEVDTAAGLDPKNLDARFDLLEYDLQAPRLMGGGKDKAAAIAEEIARIDPSKGDLAQARIAQDREDPAAQESWYLKALAAKPQDYDVLIALSGLYNAAVPPKPGSAEKFARDAIKADPARAAAYSSLAFTLASQARWKDLDESLKSAATAVSEDLAPYYQAGRAILTTNPAGAADLNRAEGYFRKYLAAEPEGAEPTLAHAHWRLGLVLEKEGRKADARSEIETASRLKPDLIEAKKDLKRLE